MKLILDACVAIPLLIEEADSAITRALLADFRNQIHELQRSFESEGD